MPLHCEEQEAIKIDPTLVSILLATVFAGVVSISAAAVFSFALLSKVVERMVSLSVGIVAMPKDGVDPVRYRRYLELKWNEPA